MTWRDNIICFLLAVLLMVSGVVVQQQRTIKTLLAPIGKEESLSRAEIDETFQKLVEHFEKH